MHVRVLVHTHSSEREVLKVLKEEKWKTTMMDTLKEEVERIGNW